MTIGPGKAAKGRYDWERAIISRNGPRSATTRLVLLVVATHVARGKAHAWPSLRTLEAETGLSNRSVIDQLEIAVREGWLLLQERTRLEGMRYRGNVYHLTIPASGERDAVVAGAATGERGSPVQASYPQPAATGEPGAASGERHDGQLVNVVPRTSLFNRKKNRFGEQGGVLQSGDGTAKPAVKDVKQWAQELGIAKGIGEHEGAFQARVANVVECHKQLQRAADHRSRSAFSESV